MNANLSATRTPRQLVTTVFRAVAVAAGIAVVVLQAVGTLTPATANTLLGLGLAALAIASLQ